VVVFKSIPLWFSSYLTWRSNIYDYFITVEDMLKSMTVLITHLLSLFIQDLIPTLNDFIDKLLSVRRISHTLEEFDAFFSLQLLKPAVFFDESLFFR